MKCDVEMLEEQYTVLLVLKIRFKKKILPFLTLPLLPLLPLLLRKMSTTTVSAMAAMSAGAPLTKINIELAPLQADEVEIKITHCGVCASDHHLAEGHWGPWSVYPQVCGHEIVGTVSKAGSLVTGLEIGQRVGVGGNKLAKSVMSVQQIVKELVIKASQHALEVTREGLQRLFMSRHSMHIQFLMS